MSKNFPFRWIFLGLNLVLLAALFIVNGLRTAPPASVPAPSAAELPVYAEVPEFSLIDQSAMPFGRQNMLGKVWVADFIFTRCAGICPMMSAHTKRLQREMKDVHFVSFTTDPEFDSPQVLAAYGKNYDAEPGRWIFLTGAKSVLNSITAAFKMSPIDEPMMHSAIFVLIDREGKVRGFYDSSDAPRLAALKKDALALTGR